VNRKRLVCVSVLVFMIFGLAGTLWALNAAYNRPNPLMDYVPQELGIYDTRYDNLTEADCRRCHGNSLADRHHNTLIVLRDNLCTPCHLIDAGGVHVTRDCTTSGCHSWNDLGPMDADANPPNGWHHSTDLSGSENCVICHSTNIVAEITPFVSFTQYPPTVVTPTPFSCENCHWDQAVVANSIGWKPGDTPEPLYGQAGHPSTYAHTDPWGNPPGGAYWEYGKDILGNFDNHHMGFKGNVASECYKCHANDPNSPDWNPSNAELIRYCEICHDVATLHTISPHVGPGGTGNPIAAEGWVAVGLHSGTPGTTPTAYQNFRANDMCWGCHADNVPAYTDELTSAPNVISYSPNSGCPGAQIEILGTDFGAEKTPERLVQMRAPAGVWANLNVYSWTDTRIVAEVPAWTFSPGNYSVRVHTEGGNNTAGVKFSLMDCASPLTIAPTEGPCNTLVSLSNGTGLFGVKDSGNAFRTIQITASQGTYLAEKVVSWTNALIKFRINKSDWFADSNGNFIKDGSESTLFACEGLNLGTWSVYLVYVFYEDKDASGTYTVGDEVYEVERSNSLKYELTNDPGITGVNPKAVVAGDIVKIVGANFGPTQTTGQVFTGTLAQYTADNGKLQNRVRMWSDTKIKIKVSAPAAYSGKTKYIWVVKAGVKSNAVKLKFL
jgi:hypothetical protein